MASHLNFVETRCEQVSVAFPSLAAEQIRVLLLRVSLVAALIHQRVQRASAVAADLRVKTQNALVFQKLYVLHANRSARA